MKARIVVVLTVLALLAASAASATSLACVKTIAGNQTTYTYTLTSTEMVDVQTPDSITSFHIYAPLAPRLIQAHTGPANWTFDAIVDPDPAVGADIYWYADEVHALAYGAHAAFAITVPSWTTTVTNHVVPECWGNWGYETASWPGAVLVSFPSIAVPAGIPEPASLLTLAFGCTGLLAALRRRRVRA